MNEQLQAVLLALLCVTVYIFGFMDGKHEAREAPTHEIEECHSLALESQTQLLDCLSTKETTHGKK